MSAVESLAGGSMAPWPAAASMLRIAAESESIAEGNEFPEAERRSTSVRLDTFWEIKK